MAAAFAATLVSALLADGRPRTRATALAISTSALAGRSVSRPASAAVARVMIKPRARSLRRFGFVRTVLPAGRPQRGELGATCLAARAAAAGGRREARADPPTSPLEDDVERLAGVGPAKARRLRSWGLGTVRSLLEYLPRACVEAGERLPIASLAHGARATVVAHVARARAVPARNRPNLTVLTLTLDDGTGTAEVVKFYYGTPPAALLAAFSPGTLVSASGGVEVAGEAPLPPGAYRKPRGTVSLKSAEVTILKPVWEGGVDEPAEPPAVVPVYRLPAAPGEAGSGRRGAAADLRLLRSAIAAALPYADLFEDPLPPEILSRVDLPPLPAAIRDVHAPPSPEAMEAASRRHVFDELLALQLALLLRKRQRRRRPCALQRHPEGNLVKRFRDSLPFELTGAQRRALDDITADLAADAPMSRLVMGDVGSGKTVVAAAALLGAVEAGAQAALMAPTEILAAQHYRSVLEWCTPLGVSVALLTGSITGRSRTRVLEGIASGATSIVVGTHALLEPTVRFSQLGLCVIDEQHRYGVVQRSRLTAAAGDGVPFAEGDEGEDPEGIDAEEAGERMARSGAPHILSMSATPIPRTLALALHGDLDITVLDEMPAGRKPVRTRLLRPEEREQAYDAIREHCARGRQAYVLLPLVEESEALAHLRDATGECERLAVEVFPELRVDLLHGRLPPQERDLALAAFVEGRTDVLVCTTIVEVGVDVPNATVMLVEGAERFGLAQLHQLRGRIGRGEAASECLLVASAPTPGALERLAALERCSDGFLVAEQDLAIRGAGQLLGTRQSGLPGLHLSDLSRPDHARLLLRAREAAEALAGAEGGPAPALREALRRRFEGLGLDAAALFS